MTPRVGDSVWHHEYKNGVVRAVLYDDNEVIVFFHNSKQEEAIDLALFDTFNDRLNQWQIQGL